MAYPPKKKAERLYHSEIAQSPNGVELRFVSDVKLSKFADGQPYVFVERRDGTECMFLIENDDIKSVVDNTPQKKWVTLKGEGKGPGAWMIVEDESGPVMPVTSAQGAGNDPRQKPPEKPAAPKAIFTPADVAWMQTASDATDIAALIYGRLEAAGHPLDSAGKASVFSTVFIAMDRRN
jgi:hypothetical protein